MDELLSSNSSLGTLGGETAKYEMVTTRNGATFALHANMTRFAFHDAQDTANRVEKPCLLNSHDVDPKDKNLSPKSRRNNRRALIVPNRSLRAFLLREKIEEANYVEIALEEENESSDCER